MSAIDSQTLRRRRDGWVYTSKSLSPTKSDIAAFVKHLARMLQRQAFTGAAAAIICDTVAETLLRIATRPDCEQQGRRIELSLTIGCNELSVQVKAPPSSYVWDEMPESTGTESSLRRPPADLTEHDVAANVSRSVRDGVLSFRWRCLPKVGE